MLIVEGWGWERVAVSWRRWRGRPRGLHRFGGGLRRGPHGLLLHGVGGDTAATRQLVAVLAGPLPNSLGVDLALLRESMTRKRQLHQRYE